MEMPEPETSIEIQLEWVTVRNAKCYHFIRRRVPIAELYCTYPSTIRRIAKHKVYSK